MDNLHFLELFSYFIDLNDQFVIILYNFND